MCQNALWLEVHCVQNHDPANDLSLPQEPCVQAGFVLTCSISLATLSGIPVVLVHSALHYVLFVNYIPLASQSAGERSPVQDDLFFFAVKNTPQLSAVIEVMSYYRLSLAASGVILESASLTSLKRSSAASSRRNLYLL